ncbi:histone deacetylase family protein [Salaquimonas pukyongi]|uniref:histone deacetylase family protein n=1 Tax=Salaquimonas pukyongi TaxID=2712698 RepID=UPI00096B718A|nr:histone deacetylase family protein [Salaquimonas pukyongi]
MRVIYSEKHALRDAKTELHGGQLVPPFEAPFRAEWILDAVRKQGHGEVISPDPFDLSAARKLHDADYLDFMATIWERWVAEGYKGEAIPACFPARRMQANRPPRDIDGALGYYSFAAETAISAGTWEAAIASMQVAMTGAKHVLETGKPAFALCRPPGHHASIDQYGGYCFINNAGAAAQYWRDNGMRKTAILDVDFHHGNGTQDIFYKRGDVFFASIHGDPLDAFPHFLGFADETGEGEGEGSTVNYPLPPGTLYGKWKEALKDALQRIVDFGAEGLIISLGVDTFEKDPISFFRLSSDDFLRYGEEIAKAGLPTLFCMEGGYGVKEIGLNTANVLTGFEAGMKK